MELPKMENGASVVSGTLHNPIRILRIFSDLVLQNYSWLINETENTPEATRAEKQIARKLFTNLQRLLAEMKSNVIGPASDGDDEGSENDSFIFSSNENRIKEETDRDCEYTDTEDTGNPSENENTVMELNSAPTLTDFIHTESELSNVGNTNTNGNVTVKLGACSSEELDLDPDWSYEDEIKEMNQSLGEDACSIEKKAQILKLIRDHPKWGLRSIQNHGGAAFKAWTYKKLWEEQVAAGATRLTFLRKINAHVLAKYKAAKERSETVMTADLQKWALDFSSAIRKDCPGLKFSASQSWAIRFCKRNDISFTRDKEERMEIASSSSSDVNPDLLENNVRIDA